MDDATPSWEDDGTALAAGEPHRRLLPRRGARLGEADVLGKLGGRDRSWEDAEPARLLREEAGEGRQ